jgi:hypothetical protein
LTQAVPTGGDGVATSAIPVASLTDGDYTVVASYAALPTAAFAMKNGIVYFPEVCTSMEPLPSGGVNTTIGGVGSPASWAFPTRLSDPAQGSLYSQVTQAAPNSNQSYYILGFPSPATWTADIDDAARINSIEVEGSKFEIYTTGRVEIWAAYIRAGDVMFSQITNGAPPTNTWFDFGPLTFTFPSAGANALSGAQLKAGNTGVAFNARPNLNADASVRVNGVTVRVCYQNPDEPETTVDVPLHYCEA